MPSSADGATNGTTDGTTDVTVLRDVRPWGGAGGVQGRIAHERVHRDELGIPGVDVTLAVLRESVRTGTTAIRTHVDVDLGIGLLGIEVVREAVATLGGAVTAQVVAFPQDGVDRDPGGRVVVRDGEVLV